MKKVDYRSLLNGEKEEKDAPSNAWWTLSETEIPAAIEATVNSLYKNQSLRQNQIQISTRLYGNLNLTSSTGMSTLKNVTMRAASKDRITFNVCQSVVDTITSKISKNKPKPLFLSSGGDYKIHKKAEKLGKFIDGCFYENEIYKLGVDVFRDSAIWGDGVIHVFSHNGKIRAERVLVGELYVDELEGFYGKPRQMHRAKNLDRRVLKELYPDSKAEIETATAAKPEGTGYDGVSDLITVIESWHLPSGPEAEDGMHIITIDGKVLMMEKYERHYFPFAIIKWSKRLYGFYGQGLIEQIQNIQTEINKLLWVIQRSMHLSGSFKVMVENGSKIVKEHLNNELGTIVSYTGTPPTYVVPPVVAPEVYSHLTTLKNAAYEQAGISQLSAAALKPAGLNSGRALREMGDIESDRFTVIGQQYEDLFIDVAKLMIAEAKDLYTEDKKFSVKVPGRKFIEEIQWKEVNLPDDQFIMQIFPVSKLPDEPSGRLDTIQDLMGAGLISPQTGRRLLDYPDLEDEESLANAEEDLLHMMLEKIVEQAEYTPPEPTDNLQLAEKLTLEFISKGRLNGLEDDKLDMLRTFLDQVHLLQQKASAPPPVPPGAAPGPNGAGGPPANPTPTPTSPMLNNTNNPTPQV